MWVTLHRKGAMGLMGVVLLKHGPNEVSASDWDKVKGHPVVKDAIRKGKHGGLTIEANPTPGAPASKPRRPPEQPAPEHGSGPDEETNHGRRSPAKVLVERVTKMNLQELDELEKAEERKVVLKAIAARRDELRGDGE